MLITRLKNILNSNTFIIILLVLSIFRVCTINYNYKITNNTEGIITKVYSNRFIIKDTIIYGETNYKIGDYVKVYGIGSKIENNRIFNLFNYKKYLLSLGIKYKIYSKSIVKLNNKVKLKYKVKNKIIDIINSRKNSSYLHTFILGNNNYLEDNIKETYRMNGISHLFSISGMHVSLLTFLLLYILNKIKKSSINYIVIILFLLFFVFLTDYSKSVIRAVSLYILIVLNKEFKLGLSTIKLLVFVLLFNLIINPYNIYNIGFIFSYTISFYLILFNKIINRHSNYFIKVLVTSFISFLVSIPILINNYFSINLLTIINNIIFVPLISIIIFPLCLIDIFINIDFILLFFINILETLSLFLVKLNIQIILCKMNILITLFYFIIITFVLYKIYKKKYLYIFLIIIVLFIHTSIRKDNFITYLDVGQGDSIFLSLNKKSILIDTGENSSKDIISYIKSNGINKINYMIISHGDFDHMGEAINLVNNFKVEKVIFNCGPYNDLESELIKVLDKKKIPYYSCISELNINNNKLYFLQTKLYDNENDNSNVIITELNGYKFMFMGDASITTEKEILNKYNLPDIDVLKVGHHGSKTSSGKEFINEINPKNSIISVGKNNRYGHPNKDVLNTLENSKIYRTDQDGSIMFKIQNNKLKIETCSP